MRARERRQIRGAYVDGLLSLAADNPDFKPTAEVQQDLAVIRSGLEARLAVEPLVWPYNFKEFLQHDIERFRVAYNPLNPAETRTLAQVALLQAQFPTETTPGV